MNQSARSASLITGASSGIGLNFAYECAQDGFDVVLVARSRGVLEDVAATIEKKYGVKAYVVAADLSNIKQVQQVCQSVDELGVTIECVINNAGFGGFGEFIDTDWEKEYQMIELNITALTYLTKYFARQMSQRGQGKILNVASIAGFLPGPLMAVYYATKAFVVSFSEAVAEELKDSGVSVTVLCPGPVETKFVAHADLEKSKLFKRSKPASASSVARYGYQAMKRGQRVAVHLWSNKLVVFILKFIPRRILTKIVAWMQRME